MALAQEHGYLESNGDSHVPKFGKNPAMQPTMVVLKRDEHRKRDGPWDTVNVLSLDGGGIRSLGSLFILQKLMKEIGKVEQSKDPKARSSAYSSFVDCLTEEDLDPSTKLDTHDDPRQRKEPAYRPCHYFDYIAGTSTGGLIALMLGRMRMSVDDALTTYKQLSDSILSLSLFRLGMSRIGFKTEALMENYKRIIDELHPLFPSPKELGKDFRSDSRRCKTIICSVRSKQDEKHKNPCLFRSYDNSPDIWHVAQVASTAPVFSKPIAIGDELYYDAAAFYHNPTRYVLDEVRREAQGRLDTVDVLLSIGAGQSGYAKGGARHGSNIRKPQRTHISDRMHESLERDSQLQRFDYHRLNVDDLRTGRLGFEQIEHAATKYLEEQHVREQIERIANRLVDIRLRRAKTMRWEHFATGMVYKCPISGCPESSTRFEDRGDLMYHLEVVHDPPPDVVDNGDIQALLDKGRTNSG